MAKRMPSLLLLLPLSSLITAAVGHQHQAAPTGPSKERDEKRLPMPPEPQRGLPVQRFAQAAGPVVPGVQELPRISSDPEESLRSGLKKAFYEVQEPFHQFFEESDHYNADWYHAWVDGLQAFFGRLQPNCMFNFVGELWDRAKCVQIRWTWFVSVMACLAVVLCGVLPALILPIETGAALHSLAGTRKLNRLLSFAVGSLLGDVFLHILPETWNNDNFGRSYTGLWILAGILLCVIVEKFCTQTEDSHHKVTAIMNLVANFVDNFTHGLAVGAGFLVNMKFGLLTTFAILVHEIPHEISDFAILLRADLNRWQAVKAQLLTAVGGILGATVALLANGDAALSTRAAWILPFTAGGFLNIALVEILPDLMKETNRRENIAHIFLILLGVAVMGVLNLFHMD